MIRTMKAFLVVCSCLVSFWGTVQGSTTTHIVPLAHEETKKRGLLHRHLHDCLCNNSTTELGGQRHHRNLADAAAQAMLERQRRRLSDSNVADLINNLAVTLQGGDDAAAATTTSTTGTSTTPPPNTNGEDVVPVVPPNAATTTTTEQPIADISSDEQALALQVAGILQGAMGDLDQVAVYTKHYQATTNANNSNQDVQVSQDVVGVINIILDFIFDLIQLVIGVIQSIISLIINTIVAILSLVVGVIVAIFQFIADIIQSIIDKILGVFSADNSSTTTTSDNEEEEATNNGPLLSFFSPAASKNDSSNNPDNDDDTETKPALQAIYESLVQGVESIGMGDVTQIVADNSDLLGGVFQLSTTTAPLILMEFIGASATNSILCLIGATESVVDGACPTTTTTGSEPSNTLSQESVCAACEATAELEGTP